MPSVTKREPAQWASTGRKPFRPKGGVGKKASRRRRRKKGITRNQSP